MSGGGGGGGVGPYSLTVFSVQLSYLAGGWLITYTHTHIHIHMQVRNNDLQPTRLSPRFFLSFPSQGNAETVSDIRLTHTLHSHKCSFFFKQKTEI